MTTADNIIGLDLGGANLKFADLNRNALTIPFPLWISWQKHEETLRHYFREFPKPRLIALSMTGELADCFTSKPKGSVI